jgi:hypothetical protein
MSVLGLGCVKTLEKLLVGRETGCRSWVKSGPAAATSSTTAFPRIADIRRLMSECRVEADVPKEIPLRMRQTRMPQHNRESQIGLFKSMA